MIEEIYGIIHGGFKDFCGMHAGELFVEPSFEVMERLSNLPKHTKIGVEYFSELCKNAVIVRDSINVDGKRIEFDKGSDYYWKDIFRIIKDNELDVVFLDDMTAMIENTRKLLEAEKIRKSLEELEHEVIIKQENLFPNSSNNEIGNLREQLYKTVIEAEYIHIVKREEKILENLLKNKPKIAIMGLGHVDYLILSNQLKKGTDFGFYHKDIVSDIEHLTLFEGQYIRAEFIENAEADNIMFLKRDHLLRKYNSVINTRIFPQRNPQFVGTWDVEVPSKGLFEIYLEKQNGKDIEGTIEDAIGKATFNGTKDNEQIYFTKKYSEEAKRVGGAKEDIEYNGFSVNGKYEGLFKFQDDFGIPASGKFWLNEFKKL